MPHKFTEPNHSLCQYGFNLRPYSFLFSAH